MQRYFAAVLTSNQRDSTSDPGATSLGSMAYLQCFGRGKWSQKFRYEAPGALPPAKSASVVSAFSDRTTLGPIGLEQLRNEARATGRSAAIVCAGERAGHAQGPHVGKPRVVWAVVQLSR